MYYTSVELSVDVTTASSVKFEDGDWIANINNGSNTVLLSDNL